MPLSEFEIINKYLRPVATQCQQSLNLYDDVASFSFPEDSRTVISKDIFTENVHFTLDESPFDIAKRLLMTNVSDIASSGGVPKYYLLGLPMHEKLNSDFYENFCAGMLEAGKKYNMNLIGGDTVKVQNDLFFSVTVIGESASGLLLRSNAQVDDLIFVTGRIGDSLLYLKSKSDSNMSSIISDDELRSLRRSFYDKSIAVDFMNQLSKLDLVKCATDVSDGFYGDLINICQSSKVSARIDRSMVPLSKAAISCINSGLLCISDLLSFGDDYEIIFTAEKNSKNDILTLAKRFKIDLNIVGDVVKEEKYPLLDLDNNFIKLNYTGYEH